MLYADAARLLALERDRIIDMHIQYLVGEGPRSYDLSPTGNHTLNLQVDHTDLAMVSRESRDWAVSTCTHSMSVKGLKSTQVYARKAERLLLQKIGNS